MRDTGNDIENRGGFTLVELMVVVAVVGLLATIAVPSIVKARQSAQVSRVANNLRIFSDAFGLYSMNEGAWPIDTHNTLPPGMEEYISVESWNSAPFGGSYNWEGPTWGEGGGYDYAGISLFESQATLGQMGQLDAIIDDGNLATGSFRLTNNRRYTYIFEER